MKVIITGVNGFIGRNVAKKLKNNHYVIGVGRNKETNADVDEYIQWDVGKDEIPNNFFNKYADAIIHSAACLSKSDEDEELIITNCLGAYRVYLLNRITNSKLSILFSSVPIIGQPNGEITEDTLVNPNTMYHATKAAQEMILNQLLKYDIRHINLRIPSPIGPDMPAKTILPIFIRRALENKDLIVYGKGTRAQNYIDVRDISNIVDKLLNNKNISGTFNCGSKNAISNVNLAKLCIEMVNSASNIIYDNKVDDEDDIVWNISSNKLYKILNYMPQYTLKKSILDICNEMNRKKR